MKYKTKLLRKDFLLILGCVVFLLINLGAVAERGRGHAKKMVCLTNANQLARAWLLYADDNDGNLVGGHVGGQYDWVEYPSWGALEQKKKGIREGVLFPYVGDVYMYHCPADQRLKDPRQGAFRSFSIAGGANGQSWPTYERAEKYSEIKSPATKYVFVEEADPRGYNMGSWVMYFNPLRWVDPVAMWHYERSALGFADGHLEMHRWSDRSFIEWCQLAMYDPVGFSFGMTPPADEREDIEYMAEGFPCRSHY